MNLQQQHLPDDAHAHEAPAIPRGYVLNWWALASGSIVQICKLWLCRDTGRMMASVRYVDVDGNLSVNAFDMTLSNITRFGRRVVAR